MKGSTAAPTQTAQLNTQIVNFNAQGVKGNPSLNTSTNIDLKLADDNLITGGVLNVEGGTFGDNCDVQIVDVDGVVAPAGTVLNQFVTNWMIVPSLARQADFDLPYVAKIYAGLYIRLVYRSVAMMGSKPNVSFNYRLHKAIV